MTWDLPSVRRESRIEWPLWLAVAGLMLFGAAFIFSATGTTDGADLCRGKTVFDSPIVEDSAADCEADASRKDCHEAGP